MTRCYGPRWALRGISFEVRPREIVGFLGPNGAGKSTTMRILTGYLAATSGTARVAGIDATANPASLRQALGYLPESQTYYEGVRVDEYLAYRARLKGIPAGERRAQRDRALERCGLAQVRRRIVNQLSKGYRQRVGLADALLGSPPVLILDEPTVGLDPHSIRELRSLIAELGADHAVLLSSHVLPEVEALARRVVIIHDGAIVAAGTTNQLTQLLPGAHRIAIQCAGASQDELAAALAGVPGVAGVEFGPADQDFLAASVRGHADAPGLRGELFRLAAARGWTLRELYLDPPNLEEIFVAVTGAPATGPTAAAASPSMRSTETDAPPTTPTPAVAPPQKRCGSFRATFAAQYPRELAGYLLTPLGWIALTVFLLITASSFFLYTEVTRAHSTETTNYFFSFVFYWFLALFLPPILTMRTFAEERSSGRLESLLTAPVSVGALVLAKYGAALTFFSLMWGLTASYFGALDWCGRHGPAMVGIDWGPVCSGYLGTFGLGAMLLAMGTFTSILARDQLVAAVLAIILALTTFLVGFLIYAVRDPAQREFLLCFSLVEQMRLFGRGIVDSRFLVYNGTVAAALLAAGTRTIQARRWL